MDCDIIIILINIIIFKFKKAKGDHMLEKLRDSFKRWLHKEGKKKIYDISCVIGYLSGICLFFVLIFNQIPDTKPYTQEELKELYIQKEMVSEGNYEYEKLKEFSYNVNFYSDYYISVFENEEVRISEYTDYDGKFLKKDISDKKLSKFFAFLLQFIFAIVFGIVVMYISCMILGIYYYVFYKYLFMKILKFKKKSA
ncbi:MAG: hypothetical protein K0R72_280 [Clostridia bacterium]|jgi:hypothetical protein|nr:hypothetical protein [Clostridia bacterium]